MASAFAMPLFLTFALTTSTCDGVPTRADLHVGNRWKSRVQGVTKYCVRHNL